MAAPFTKQKIKIPNNSRQKYTTGNCWAPDTFLWYQYRLQRFADRFPKLTVGELRPFHLQEWVDPYKDHSPTTTRNYMRCMKRCLKWAKALGYVDGNPIEFLTVPAGTSREVFVPPDLFNRLLEFAHDPSLSDLMRATYETGCRPQECHWALQNQQGCECSVSGLKLVFRTRGIASSQCFEWFLSAH